MRLPKPTATLSKPLRQHLGKLKQTLTLRVANKLLKQRGLPPLKKLLPLKPLGSIGLKESGPGSSPSPPQEDSPPLPPASNSEQEE